MSNQQKLGFVSYDLAMTNLTVRDKIDGLHKRIAELESQIYYADLFKLLQEQRVTELVNEVEELTSENKALREQVERIALLERECRSYEARDSSKRIAEEQETSRLLRAINIIYEQRIALLEKVAEAAEQSIVNKHGIWVGPTVMQTLRAAGYLGGGE